MIPNIKHINIVPEIIARVKMSSSEVDYSIIGASDLDSVY